MAVPKIIHQFFAVGWDAVPPEAKNAIRLMRQQNPDWEYRFYDAAAAEAFIAERCDAHMLEVYRSIDPVYAAARADLFRYLVCYEEGGLYLDIKSTARAPLDTVFGPNDRYVLSQWFSKSEAVEQYKSHPELKGIRGGEYVQWFMACEAGHPYLAEVIKTVLHNIKVYRPLRDGAGRLGVLRLTGPIAYTLAIHPIIAKHPHVFRDYQADLKFAYSVYGDIRTHRTKLGSHYTAQTRPIIKTSLFETVLCMIRYGPMVKARKWLSGRKRGLVSRCQAMGSFLRSR